MGAAALEKIAGDHPASVRLKQATRAVHEQLHRTPLLAAFERAELDIAGYVRVMHVFHEFYASIDEPVEDAMPLLAAMPEPFKYVPRAPMFARDLASLGVVLPSATMSRSTRFAISSAAELSGVLYVVEGSILGGAGLNRCAGKILQHDDLAGRYYWLWCRENAASRWSSVRRMLDSSWAMNAGEAEMLAAAGKTFDDLLQRFESAAAGACSLAGAGR